LDGRYLQGYMPTLPSAIAWAAAASTVFGVNYAAYNME
jgi:hypothetical protein